MMVLMGMVVKGKYSAGTGRLDNSDQIAAIRRRLVVEFGMEMVPDRMSAAPPALLSGAASTGTALRLLRFD